MTDFDHDAKAGSNEKLDTVIRDGDGEPYDLSNAKVGVTVTEDDASTIVLDTTATIEDADKGKVSYNISAPTEPSLYLVEWAVADSGNRFRYPRNGYEEFYVDSPLATNTLGTPLRVYGDGTYDDGTYNFP